MSSVAADRNLRIASEVGDLLPRKQLIYEHAKQIAKRSIIDRGQYIQSTRQDIFVSLWIDRSLRCMACGAPRCLCAFGG